MPGLPSEVTITYDGVEIQDSVIASGTRFASNMSAMPGTAEILVRDMDQTHTFVTGKEIILSLDGVALWGGYITAARRRFAFPAVDTVTRTPSQVRERQWSLSAVDFNILFDKRVIRQTTDYLHQLPNFDTEDFDGALIREALGSSKYIDVPSGFDVSSEIDDIPAYRAYNTLTNGAITSGATTVTVDNVDVEPSLYPYLAVIKDDPITGGNREIVQVTGRTGLVLTIVRAREGTSAIAHGDNSFFMHFTPGAWPQQGSPWRAIMEDFAQFSGAVYYISPDKKVHYHSLETAEARWGFSDLPNKNTVTASPVEYQGATYGFRDIDASEDGSPIVNDAFVWGGSEFSGSGQTVFARRTNTTSITDHGRWQLAETHFGDTGFKLQSGVDVRAKVIVDGDPGAVGGDPNRGLRFPQWNISLGWFAKDVPIVSGTPDHLRAGQLVTIQLQTFDNLEIVLPMRQLTISFPAKASEVDKAWVRFDGTFSLQLSDPYTLWQYLIKLSSRGRGQLISTVDGSNPAPYGSFFTGEPEPTTDGSTVDFDLPDGRGYIAGTLEVYIEPGELLRSGIDYIESNPDEGIFTMTLPPSGGTWLWVVCRTL